MELFLRLDVPYGFGYNKDLMPKLQGNHTRSRQCCGSFRCAKA